MYVGMGIPFRMKLLGDSISRLLRIDMEIEFPITPNNPTITNIIASIGLTSIVKILLHLPTYIHKKRAQYFLFINPMKKTL